MRKMEDSLAEFISKYEATDPLLPLTHITNMYGMRSIIGGMTLDPQDCEVFSENILYLFYGRPAYRASKYNATNLRWNVPIAFILKPEKVRSISRIFPFDSGAFKKGFFEEYFSPESDVRDFDLGSNLNAAAKFVSALYQDNPSYYRGSSPVELEIANWDFELQGLQYLSKMPGEQGWRQSGPDERASAIEIQVNKPITIRDSVLALIVPESLLGDSTFLAATRRWGLTDEQILDYLDVNGHAPDSWTGRFYEKVHELYKNNSYL